MGRQVKRLSNLEIDEVSLVDRPANQHGLVAIAKAHSQEDSMSVYDAEGREVFEDELNVGDFVYDEDGSEYQVVAGDGIEDEGQEQEAPEGELQEVGKAGLRQAGLSLGDVGNWAKGHPNAKKAGAAFTAGRAKVGEGAAYAGRNRKALGIGAGVGGAAGLGAGYAGGSVGKRAPKSLGEQVLETLSKSVGDDDRDAIIAKAFDGLDEIAKRNDQLEDLVYSLIAEREEQQYGEVAKSYGIPAEDADIGGLLYRASQVLPEEDVVLLDRLFTSAGEVAKAYYDEVGVAGGYESSIMAQMQAVAGEAVAKGAEAGLSQEQAITALFAANPAAYDEYEAEQGLNGR